MKKRIIACVFAALMAVACVGCNGSKKSSGWSDTVPRPEIPEPDVMGSYVTYPAAPASAPSAPDETKLPSIESYTANREANEEEGGYTVDSVTVEETQYPRFSYNGLKDWDYVYAKVDNYRPEYGNIILTVNAPSAEKIAVQAVYYEMYTQSNRAVTVYSGDLGGATDRRLIAKLGDFNRLNSEWQSMGKEYSLQNAAILGFAIFVDSSPAQVASDRIGSLTVKSFKFAKGDDPDLDVQYVVPSVNYDAATSNANSGYTITSVTDPENADVFTGMEISYDKVGLYSQVYLPILDKESIPDYAEFSIKLETKGVQSYSIGVMYSTGGNAWQPYVQKVNVANTNDGVHEHSVNFDGDSVIATGGSPVAGEFITDHGVYQICLWIDSLNNEHLNKPETAKVTVSDVVFTRTATDSARVGKTWSAQNVPSAKVGDDVDFGGKGSFTYSWYNTWYYLSMPVSGYKVDSPKSKLTVKFTSEDEIDRFGIAIVSANVRQNNGEAVISSTWEKFAPTQNGAAGKDSAAYGTTFTAVKEGNDWTIVFDFSHAKDLENGNPFWKARISSIRIYLNDPTVGATPWEGTKTITFTSIEFAD